VWKWNYRITVEIETPEGVKTGSAVRQVQARLNLPKLNPDVADVLYNVMGEAVVIDLGERGTVFALIGWGSYEEVFSAFPYSKRDSIEFLNYYKNLKKDKKAELSHDHAKLVTFTDMSDPLSVKLVKGWKFNKKTQKHDPVDDFEALFGAGVKLKSV
ncbi:MAG: hypothetical protein ACRBDL_11840, partial [Alphaproteobacteria bacterium]